MKGVEWPSDRELSVLRQAAKDIRFLLARGYARNSAITFVGNHYQLNRLHRNLLFRAVFPRDTCLRRRRKRLRVGNLFEKEVLVDGYNCFITLESALRGLPVIRCDDGFVRDISGVFRSFSPSDKTVQAWRLMERVFQNYRPRRLVFFLDAPYSNSGRFCARIRSWLCRSGFDGGCVLIKGPEKEIAHDREVVVTGDSVIIDGSRQVFDLTGHVVSRMLRIRPISLSP